MSRGGHSRIYLYPRRRSLKAGRSAPGQRHLVRFGPRPDEKAWSGSRRFQSFAEAEAVGQANFEPAFMT
jgi:hypothetical protein